MENNTNNNNNPIFVAYFALLAGAVIPIVIGSFGSLKPVKNNKTTKVEVDSEDEEEQTESLSSEDAMWFPIMGSCTLFGLYILFKYFGKEYINYLLTAYFALLGTGALSKTIHQLLKWIGVTQITLNQKYRLTLWNRSGKKEMFKFYFDYFLIATALLSALLTAYYVYSKNWIASNVFGEAFSVSAIQLLDLDDFKTGMILLSGLFVYDIFWVFGTEVMVSVAKNFDAPVKLLFPKNLFADKLEFTMLGLGDIVIPGIFVALCLRFDQYLAVKNGYKSGSFKKPYFTACVIAYILGLVTTVAVMHTFKAAQPALLYLSPACILSAFITAAVRGELSQLFAYKSASKVDKETKEKDDKKKSK